MSGYLHEDGAADRSRADCALCALAFISQVGSAFGQFTEVQKKEFASLFIEQIEIYQEEQENGDVIKSVTFRFPICKEKRELNFSSGNGQTTGTDVETVVLMSKVKIE